MIVVQPPYMHPRSLTLSIHFRRGLLLSSALLILTFAAACTNSNSDVDPTPAGTTQGSDSPMTSPTPSATTPDAPTEVTITGAIPNLQTPVPAGEGERGRITVSWVAPAGDVPASDIDAYRIYTDCGSGPVLDLEVPASELSYGPLNPCRPSQVGVATVIDDVESEIAWGTAAAN